jgi:hypothetical protein
MQNPKNKQKLSTIPIISMLAIATLVFGLPIVNAADSIPTNAFLAVSPNPAGVNQEVTVMMWLIQFKPTAGGVGTDRWEDYTLVITKPDSTAQTFGPFTADPASFAYTVFTPDQIGTYTLEFSFPGEHVEGVGPFGNPVDLVYEASSFTTTLTVQEEPVTASPQTPLPTEYWTRPIDAQNFDWYTISGNWFGTGKGGLGGSAYNASGNFNPYTTVPNTGHIVWTKPLMIGGLIGGEFGGSPMSQYYCGKSYEAGFRSVAIINGVLYYNAPANNPGDQGFYAVDLRTGETLWHQNTTTSLTCGQVYNYMSPNQEGGIPYLWAMNGPIWQMYDAFTGNLILQIANATSGSISFTGGGNIVEGPNGELLVYVLDSANNWLAMWNSSSCISQTPWMWRPQRGSIIDWQNGVQWNVTIDGYPGETFYFVSSGVILATTGDMGAPQNWQMEVGYDMITGEQLWVQNRTTPIGATGWGLMGAVGNGIYTEFDKGAMQWSGYNVYTGEKIWGPTEAYTDAWGSLPTNDIFSTVAYDIFYAFNLDGLHAFDVETGERLWDFYGDPAGFDFPGYSTLPFENNMLYTIADGKVIASTGDSHGVPEYRGAKLYAVDAYSGDEIWSIKGYYQTTMPVADGYLVAFNAYDNEMYTFGKGPTATTISAPENIQVLGDKVLIKGTVTDQSAGTKQNELAARFPNGVPAVADGYMSAWMEYLYMQQPCPDYVEGVEVVLETLDPNGNFYEIGRTTSSASGVFACEVDLPVPGLYDIIATFEGSESYYGSYAETYVSVEDAPSAAQQIEPEQPASAEPEPAAAEPAELGVAESMEITEAPFISTEVVIIAAVAVACVISVVAFCTLRKRK